MNFKLKNFNKIVLLIAFLSGCTYKKNKKINLGKQRFYTLVVDGVECAQCAKKAVVSLESVPEVLHAEYVCNDHEYSDCFARVYAKSKRKNLSIVPLRRALSKVGFELSSIQGRFAGIFMQSSSKVLVEGQEYHIDISQRLFDKYQGKKKVFAGRFISKNNNEWFEV